MMADVQQEQPIPPENTVIQVKVTVVETPNVFYAQIQRTTKKCSSFSYEMTLKDLHNHMNLPNEIKLLESFETVPAYGELVIAPYLDGSYYRGKFMDCIEESCTVRFANLWTIFFLIPPLSPLQIFYVDYGDYGQVKLKNLRKFNSNFSYLPFQAVKFQLANCIPKQTNVEEARRTLSDLCSSKTLKAKIVKNTHECVFVHLFDEQAFNVGETLIKLGTVEPRRGSLDICSHEQIPG